MIKALSLQKQTIFIHIIGHWLISVPLQLIFAFTLKLHGKGLWFAKLVLETYTFFAYTLLLYITNWDQKSEEAADRIRKDEEDAKRISDVDDDNNYKQMN